MIINCRRLRNILSFLPYLSVDCICASLPKIVDRIRHERGEAPRAGLLKIIYTTCCLNVKITILNLAIADYYNALV